MGMWVCQKPVGPGYNTNSFQDRMKIQWCFWNNKVQQHIYIYLYIYIYYIYIYYIYIYTYVIFKCVETWRIPQSWGIGWNFNRGVSLGLPKDSEVTRNPRNGWACHSLAGWCITCCSRRSQFWTSQILYFWVYKMIYVYMYVFTSLCMSIDIFIYMYRNSRINEWYEWINKYNKTYSK